MPSPSRTRAGGLAAGRRPGRAPSAGSPAAWSSRTSATTRRSLLPELVANLPGLIQWYGAVGDPTAGFGPGSDRTGRPVPPWAAPAADVDPDHVPAPDEIRPFLFPSEFDPHGRRAGAPVHHPRRLPRVQPGRPGPASRRSLLVPAVPGRRGAAASAGAVGQQPQADRPRDAQLPLHDQPLPARRDPRQERQAAPELAGGDPALHRAGGALQRVQARRALGQPAQQAPARADARRLRRPRTPADAGDDVLPGLLRARDAVRPEGQGGRRARDVTDGTSNTIGVVEAKTAVPWTKPDEDIPFDPAGPRGRGSTTSSRPSAATSPAASTPCSSTARSGSSSRRSTPRSSRP